MGQRARATALGQVDDHVTRLKVRGGRVLATFATGSKGQAQAAIQGQGTRRQIQHGSQVHQRVKCFVQVGLAPALLNVVAELHATETEGVGKHLWRYWCAAAVVVAHARQVGFGSFVWRRLVPLKRLRQCLFIGITVGASLINVSNAMQVYVLAPNLFADDRSRLATAVINRKRRGLFLGAT